MKPSGHFEWEVLYWAINVASILQFKKRGQTIKSIKFENFINNPKETIEDFFVYLGIPSNMWKVAINALKEDSQKGLHFSSKSAFVSSKKWHRTKESVQRCNRILEEFELPDLDSSIDLGSCVEGKNYNP